MKSLLKIWLRPNVCIFLPIGFVSGLPLLLTSSTLGMWLADVGLDRTTIALFTLVGTPYALKFIWAPLVDQLSLGFFSRILGHRKSWIFICQIFIFIIICNMAFIDIRENTFYMAVLAFLLAFTSATHDISIDALRIELHKEEELGIGAAMYVYGYRIALLIAGAGVLIIAEYFSWKASYIFMACLIPVGSFFLLIFKVEDSKISLGKNKRSTLNWFEDALVKPFLDFKKHNRWFLILIFIAAFKWGDALLGVLSQPFMLDIGFTKTEIASVAKLYGFGATLFGLALGGNIIARYGIINSLWISGFLQLLSNFVFAYQAYVGNNIGFLAFTIGIENLAGGIGTAAFIAYLSNLCNIKYTAFQYALLSSFMAFSRTWLSSPSGWIIDNINWSNLIYYIGFNTENIMNLDWMAFFIFTGIMALPGLIILFFIQKNH